MSTRSTSTDLVPPLSDPENAPTDGVGDAIVVPPVLGSQFELKIGLLNLVTAISFHGFENDDPHSHILGGNFLTRNTQEALTIIENKSKVCTSRNKPQDSSASSSSSQNDAITALAKQVKALVSSMNKPIHSIQEGVLPNNTIPNPREDLKVITTRSGMTLVGPSVPSPLSSSSKEVEQDPKMITDQVLTKNTTRVPPPVVHLYPTSRPFELPPTPVSSPVIPE
ncbi:hypothetical protein Tco_1022478 [Tanacetum coccineum]